MTKYKVTFLGGCYDYILANSPKHASDLAFKKYDGKLEVIRVECPKYFRRS